MVLELWLPPDARCCSEQDENRSSMILLSYDLRSCVVMFSLGLAPTILPGRLNLIEMICGGALIGWLCWLFREEPRPNLVWLCLSLMVILSCDSVLLWCDISVRLVDQ